MEAMVELEPFRLVAPAACRHSGAHVRAVRVWSPLGRGLRTAWLRPRVGGRTAPKCAAGAAEMGLAL